MTTDNSPFTAPVDNSPFTAPVNVQYFDTAPLTTSTTRYERLASSRDRKVERLASRAGLSPNDLAEDTYVDVNGYRESMQNKILNDYTLPELDYLIERLYEEQGVQVTPDGLFKADGVTPYEGDISSHASLYEFGTLDGNIKIGTWGGTDPRQRFVQEYLNKQRDSQGRPAFIGVSGVDPTQLRRNRIMPHTSVRLAEGLYHGNVNALNNRVVRYDPNQPVEEYRALRDTYGTGATEVYRPFTIEEQEFDRDALWADFNERFRPLQGGKLTFEEEAARYNALSRRQDAEQGIGLAGRLGNATLGIPATVVSQLAIEPGAAVGEWLGFDTGTEEGRTRAVNDFFGYNEEFSNVATERVKESVTNIYKAIENDTSVSLSDVYNILQETATTPELLTTSLASVAAMFFGFGKFTATGKAIQGVERARRTGAIKTAAEAKQRVSQIRKDASILDRMTYMGANNAGMALTVAGNTNNSLNEFIENNNGDYSASDVLRIAAFETAIASLDRFSTSTILSNIPLSRTLPEKKAIEALKATIEEMPANTYLRAAESFGRGLVGFTGSAAMEGATEYVQTLGEVFNTRYATEKYGSDVAALLFNEETQLDALTGAALGTAMGGQMEGMNLVAGKIRPTARKISDALQKRADRSATSSSNSVMDTLNANQPTEEEITLAAERYTAVQDTLPKVMTDEEISVDELGSYLEGLVELETTRYGMDSIVDTNVRNLLDQRETSLRNRILSTLRANNGSVELSRFVNLPASIRSELTSPDATSTSTDTAAIPETKEGSTSVSTSSRIIDDGEEEIATIDSALNELEDTSEVDSSAPIQETAQEAPAATPPAVEELTPQMKALLTEYVINLVLEETKGEVSPETDIILRNFGRANKLTDSVVEQLVKSYAAVETEIQLEDRGLQERATRLRLMNEGGNASNSDYQRGYDELVSWYSTTQDSVAALKQNVIDAENKAATRRQIVKAGTRTFNTSEALPVKSTYNTHAKSSSKGEVFTSYVRYRDGRWVADVTEAQNRIRAKERTLIQLERLLNEYHTTANNKLKAERLLSFGGLNIPESTSSKAHKVAVDKERKFISNALNIIRSTVNPTGSINKVILSDARASQWSLKSLRARLNSAITNVQSGRGIEYTSSDVIYLHSNGYVTLSGGGKRIADLYGTTSVAGAEVRKAMQAGATIVVDNSARFSRVQRYAKNKKYGSTTQLGLIADFLKSAEKDHPYTEVLDPEAGDSVTAAIFVPANPENVARYEASKASVEETKKKKASRKTALDRVVATSTNLRGAKAMGLEGDELSTYQEAYDKAFEHALPYFTKEAVETAQQDLSADIEIANEAVDVTDNAVITESAAANSGETEEVSTTSDNQLSDQEISALTPAEKAETNLNKYLDRVVPARVTAIKQELRAAAKDENTVPPSYNEAVTALVEAEEAADLARAEVSSAVMEGWKTASAGYLKGKAFKAALNGALEKIGKVFSVRSIKERNEGKAKKDDIILRGVGESILQNAVSQGSNLVSYVVKLSTVDAEGNSTGIKVAPPVFNLGTIKVGDPIPARFKDAKKNPLRGTVLSVSKVEHTPHKYLGLNKDTVLNTIHADNLPAVLREVSEETLGTLQKILKPLTDAEKAFEKPNSAVDSSGLFNVINSPARALIFDKDGNIHPNIATAFGAAIRDLIHRDSYKMSLAPKDKKTIAAMFNVNEEDVTPAMRKFAEENGVLAKTVADGLGSAVLQALGLVNNSYNTAARGHYERLKSDLGNIAIRIGEAQGIFATTSPKSNDLAKLYSDGETRTGDEAEQTTPYVNVISKTVDGELYYAPAVGRMTEEFDQINELIPNIIGNLKEPAFGRKLDDGYISDAVSSIRNDIVGAQVPAEAKEALRAFMDTPFEMDLEGVANFLAIIDDKDNPHRDGVLKQLGFIPLEESDPDYAKLLHDDKLIQVSINRDVERSIQHLRDAYNRITADKDEKFNTLYFGYFYTANHRYSIDSTTLNPQADKLHRFFIQPKNHKGTYKVNRTAGTFTYVDPNDSTKSVDASLYMRAALAQAFGPGFDKEFTRDVINYGNVLLSLDKEQLDKVEEAVYSGNSLELFTEEGSIKIKPDHISHAIQGLKILRDYIEGTGDITSAITIETDALTSGFANKTQQFGTIKNLEQHKARVGIISPYNGDVTGNHAKLANPANGRLGINDLLASPENLDSYKNLARTVLGSLKDLRAGLPADKKTLFNDLAVLLPGAVESQSDDVMNQKISSALRSLFKPGFMIFNYSASIARIRSNLGQEMAHDMLSKISSLDLDKPADKRTDEEKAQVKAITELAKRTKVPVKDSEGKNTKETKVLSPKEFQDRLRNTKLDLIRVDLTRTNENNKQVADKRKLVDYVIQEIIEPTYGEAIENAFNSNFQEFIQIQDLTNDIFRVSYETFNQLLLNKVKEYRSNPNTATLPVTEEQMQLWIEELSGDFPAITGPLSNNLREGIYVYDVDTRTPNEIMQNVRSPQGQFLTGAGIAGSQRKMNPLIKSITAAANAGAVLPFHAIDGAQMAKFAAAFQAHLTSESGIENLGVLPIHDAIMVPLWLTDVAVWNYNKVTVDINKNYSIMDEMEGLLERVEKIYADSRLDIDKMQQVKRLKTMPAAERKALKESYDNKITVRDVLIKEGKDVAQSLLDAIAEAEEKMSFANDLKILRQKMDTNKKKVDESRANDIYKKGTFTSSMVGMPGSVYQVDSTAIAPDLTYLKGYTQLYKHVDVTLAAPTMEEIVDTETAEDVSSSTNPEADSGILAAQAAAKALAETNSIPNPYGNVRMTFEEWCK